MAAFNRIIKKVKRFPQWYSDLLDYGHLLQSCAIVVKFSHLNKGDIIGIPVNAPGDSMLRFEVLDNQQRLIKPIGWLDEDNLLKFEGKLLAVGRHAVFSDPSSSYSGVLQVPISAIELNGEKLTYQSAIGVAMGK